MTENSKDFINRGGNLPKEKRLAIGRNTFAYQPWKTELTNEDLKILENDFSNVSDQEIFVYKDDGELVAY